MSASYSMRRSVVLAALAAGLALACGLGAPAPSKLPGIDESKPPLQPDGPLLGLGLVPHAEGAGSVSGTQFLFSPDDREIVAVVGLGSDTPQGARLTIAWYLHTGAEERQFLFSHEIQVGPGGTAFSQALAEGGLAPGHYETVATLSEWQVRSPWVSRAVTPTGSQSRSNTRKLAAPARQTGDPSLPTPGESWWTDEPPVPGTPPPPGPCQVGSVIGSVMHSDWFTADVWVSGTCSSIGLAASAAGDPVTLASKQAPINQPMDSVHGGASFCDIPGGSDFPGTVLHLMGTGSEGASLAEDWTVPDKGSAFVAMIDSSPQPGARVEPGDSIDLHVIALQAATALGVERLRLIVDGDLLREEKNLTGRDEPVECEPLRYAAEIKTSYEVPENPPPVVEICARAVGFAGEEAEGECVEFYTGEVWVGTMTSESIADSPPGPDGSVNHCRAQYETSLRIRIDDAGVLSGSGLSNPLGPLECSQAGTIAAVSIPWTLVGASSETGFSVQMLLRPDWAFGQEAGMSTLSESPIELRREPGTSASAAFQYRRQLDGTYGPGLLELNHALTLECVSCSH